ncbi:hypothetical protein VL14_ORF160 [Staphylococcus phage vB_SauM_VL14]|nr:hypothetical protein VL14_ORF160 [Staphylococcus phage vB_SauM_VL14]
MAREAKQTVNTLLQRYRTALRAKKIIFNLTDDQIEEMDLEVTLTTKYSNSVTNQVIKGTDKDVSMLILILSNEEFNDKVINIEIEEVNIIL